ncbi:fructoselysine and glucoselysine-specific PTS system IIC component [Breznakia blatticola]|uniref:Fructoselysine and glucoselysine-specific PTS system IIC component n=1 Tax=Breznakia blatticola TaxID=1754012 RepID=A0A4R8A7Y2_9FIRM|nr:PTS sugar transporter subunit IIC [Breznakia blatticola]TDW25745.1 fructoselysine and glucoselysine-specific PTS system IIC component [Breznakia blatticola]
MIESLLLAVIAFLAAIDEYTFGASMMGRPLFTSMFVGLVLGDLQAGVTIGATLELMFMGSIMVGSATPPEVYASSVLGTAIAIQTNQGVGTAVALALPLSIFLQMWRNFCYAVPASYAGKMIETAIDNRNFNKAKLIHLTTMPIVVGIPSALLVFFATYFGTDAINSAINMIPEVVLNGFDVAAGVLSCVGLALLIKMMANKKLMPYLFIGFIAVMYLGMDVIGVAVAGLCFALLAVNQMQIAEEEEL